MSDSTVGDIVLIGALAAIGYAVYQILQPAEEAAAAVGNVASQAAAGVAAGVGAATSGLANAIVWATSTNVIPSGNVVLPNGTLVPLSQIAVTTDPSTGSAVFTYDSVAYSIIPNPSGGPAYDTSGNYHAQVYGGAPVAVNYAPTAATVAASADTATINPSTGLPYSSDPTQPGYYDTTLTSG